MEKLKKYFININGNNLGPLKYNDICERLKDGSLKPSDYIFVVGEKNWDILNELNEFKSTIEKLKEVDNNRIWFVRKNKQSIGPYSTEELLFMVQNAEIDINDYVWKKGLDNWLTLQELDYFKQEKQETKQRKALEVIKAPDSEVYVKPKKRLALPELILGLILVFIGLIQVQNHRILGLLISCSGLLVLLVFFRKKGRLKK